MQKHLLSKSDLTLKWALEIAQSKEASAPNTQQLKEGDASTFSVESVTISNRKEGCYRCGGRNHSSYWECCFKYAECHNCGRKGHIARGCHSKGAPFKAKTPKSLGTGESGPEPGGYKLTENQTVAWRIPWCARSKTEKLDPIQCSCISMEIH